MLDFSKAPDAQVFNLIPPDTFARLSMVVKPAENGWLKKSKSRDTEYMECEFTVIGGEFDKRRLWQYFVLAGGSVNDLGESIAANISRGTLKAILNSAHGILPADQSERAQKARMIDDYSDFTGMEFAAKIGIEKGKDGHPDRNKIMQIITPDNPAYLKVMSGTTSQQGPTQTASTAPTNGKNVTPAWAIRK